MPSPRDLYRNRFLSQGYPELEALGVEYYKNLQGSNPIAGDVLAYVARLIDLSKGVRSIADVGCGPKPFNVKQLLAMGYDAYGVEPVPGPVEAARAWLGDQARIHQGCAESLPFPDRSQRVIILSTVLEHVDSPEQCLAEAYRVLVPDGVLYVYTTNRYHFSPTGINDEFRTRFFNWFPALVKECYVFQHLHYDPRLANFTPRPAVHWFTYAGLCRLGRSVGFAQFYSKVDLADPGTVFSRSLPRRLLLKAVARRPWLRALVLSQTAHIIMWKRP